MTGVLFAQGGLIFHLIFSLITFTLIFLMEPVKYNIDGSDVYELTKVVNGD